MELSNYTRYVVNGAHRKKLQIKNRNAFFGRRRVNVLNPIAKKHDHMEDEKILQQQRTCFYYDVIYHTADFYSLCTFYHLMANAFSRAAHGGYRY